ncbi:hypothetical protein [Natronosalvus halobius]|uniref:hypothetical protein n=1 Tax=Natronosalvus halobius TaxID=2953746 RepID=UPI00209E3B11|nr:hypothetical protein [Natronosalvus halobius]USZ71977.1 hypothetical protein NGM15_01320 [Natronosalvus halobius]
MASKAPIYCELCKESIDTGESLEHHLLNEHRPPELAERLASQWESEELGDPS